MFLCKLTSITRFSRIKIESIVYVQNIAYFFLEHVEKDQQTTSNNVILDTVSVTDTDGLTFTYTCDPASCPISIASSMFWKSRKHGNTKRVLIVKVIRFNCIFFLIKKIDGRITSTSAFSSVFTPGYDVTIAVNDGHTTVGGKLWSMHIKGTLITAIIKQKWLKKKHGNYL